MTELKSGVNSTQSFWRPRAALYAYSRQPRRTRSPSPRAPTKPTTATTNFHSICCNTHSTHARATESARRSTPFVHVGDCVCARLKQSSKPGFQDLARCNIRPSNRIPVAGGLGEEERKSEIVSGSRLFNDTKGINLETYMGSRGLESLPNPGRLAPRVRWDRERERGRKGGQGEGGGLKRDRK